MDDPPPHYVEEHDQTYYVHQSMRNITEVEKNISKQHQKKDNYTWIHNYWTKHPFLRAPISAVLYFTGKLVGKL